MTDSESNSQSSSDGVLGTLAAQNEFDKRPMPSPGTITSIVAGLLALTTIFSGCGPNAPDGPTASSVDQIPSLSTNIDGVAHVPGDWVPMLPAGEKGRSWGNHRAVLTVPATAGSLPVTDSLGRLVRVKIPWRRHDKNPDKKAVIVVNAATGLVVANALARNVSTESGEVWFEVEDTSSEYFVYYFPYWTSGSYYPKVSYWTPDSLAANFPAEERWLERVKKIVTEDVEAPLSASVSRIESVDEFHSFFPMEVAATGEEVARFVADHPQSFYVFPEYRERPARMRHHLPVHWVVEPAVGTQSPVDAGATNRSGSGPRSAFDVTAKRGEYFTFQLGVFSPDGSLSDVRIEFSEFANGDGGAIGAEAFTSFNLGGVDLEGQPFTKVVDVPEGEVLPLWIGVEIPLEAAPSVYRGSVTVSSEDVASQTIDVHINVDRRRAIASGDNEPEKLSRLRWLNSTIGSDPEFIVDPFTPVVVSGNRVSVLGREVVLGPDGLPMNIRSFFKPELTGMLETPGEILAAPITFEIVANGKRQAWSSEPYQIAKPAAGRVEWQGYSQSDLFELKVAGSIEYDGMLDYKVALVSKLPIDVSDIQLPIRINADAATWILGLGRTGRKREEAIDWKWKVENHQEGVWLGAVNKGLQYVLRDDNYERPLNTNFYQSKPLNLPPSWYNDGRGGIRITSEGDQVVARNYSGPRKMAAGDTLHFNIRFLITPFKPINTEEHFNTRFVHKYVPVDSVKQWGGTVVNIHHANEINPYINYPFYNLDKQTAYINEAHRKGVKVKLYYTIRELTYKAHELFPMRSLGYEIFNDGDGGGHSWMQEHLQSNYHSAWHAWRVDDAAILNKGTSRWTNYYVEGLNWLAENQEIDGLYLDDIAFSRETVKRMVTVLDTHRDGVVIDLHSANQFNPADGFINSAMLYMEHFPFISRLWFGEYFDYDADPDYWMTEIAGLPFGLMGEMLQDCGRPYRGMLYGMTTRMYGDCDPRAIWSLFDGFGIDAAEMRGYWLDESPVMTDHPKVLATSYVRNGKTLVVLASWEDEAVDVRLDVDWARLGLDKKDGEISAPKVSGLQEAATYRLGDSIRVPGGEGLFLVLK